MASESKYWVFTFELLKKENFSKTCAPKHEFLLLSINFWPFEVLLEIRLTFNIISCCKLEEEPAWAGLAFWQSLDNGRPANWLLSAPSDYKLLASEQLRPPPPPSAIEAPSNQRSSHSWSASHPSCSNEIKYRMSRPSYPTWSVDNQLF